MTRGEALLFIFIVLSASFVIWYILGGSGAPFSSYVSYSALLIGCEGGIFFCHKVSRVEA